MSKERKVYRDGKLVRKDYITRHSDGCTTVTSRKARDMGILGGSFTYGKPTRTTYTRPK